MEINSPIHTNEEIRRINQLFDAQVAAHRSGDEKAYEAANEELDNLGRAARMANRQESESTPPPSEDKTAVNPKTALALALRHQQLVWPSDTNPSSRQIAHQEGKTLQRANDQLLAAKNAFEAQKNPSHKR